MTGEQRVTDEQLPDADLALMEQVARVYIGLDAPTPDDLRGAVLRLIADLRASRALEAEHQQRDFALHAEIAHCRRQRDGLQQRIDKALAWCREANPSPATNGDQFAELRAALTGTEDTP